jgi:hypothetical protein
MLYRAAAVARAAGITLGLLAQWVDRKIVRLAPPDVPAASSGVPRQFSRRRIDQIAIAAELVNVGISSSHAAEAASTFTDQPSKGRAAGELYPVGKTLLVVAADGTSVVNVSESAALDSAIDVLASVAAIVNVGAVIDRVDRALAGTSRRAA